MGKALKNIGFFLVTIILTAIIFWLVFVDKESKQGVLEYSLGLLGQKLMAMLPDTSDTQPLEALYEDFVTKAKNQEVAPEKIENVAASILNLSHIDSVISPQEAEAIIRLSLADPVRIERVAPENIVIDRPERIPDFIAVAPAPPKAYKKVSPREWAVIGERIESAYKFNTEYQKAMKKFHETSCAPEFQMHFKVEDGLRIKIDSNLKQQLDEKKYKDLQKEVQELEKHRIIVWQKDFQEEMRKEMGQKQQKLETLKKLKELEKLKHLQEFEALKALESLKNLEALQYIPVINADSIQFIIQKSLEAAGIPDSTWKQ